MELRDIALAHRTLAATPSRKEKVARLAECLRAATGREASIAACWLAGRLPQGRIGVGPAGLRRAAAAPAAASGTLGLIDVDRELSEIAAQKGAGSARARDARLAALFSRADAEERRFLSRLLQGELRQGASEGLCLDAIAVASGVAPERVRRAFMLCADLGAVARAALGPDPGALAALDLELFRPVLPMLASPADDPADALQRLGVAAFEWKLDGARVQVHKRGGDVAVYSRRQHDVSRAVPELVEGVASLPVPELILDGEALALRGDGTPHSFQTTMRRFGRRADVDAMRERLPLSAFYFDCLRVDGETLIDRRCEERWGALVQALPEALRVPRRVTGDPDRVEAFWNEALARGHEGVMAKSLDSTYAAGARGSCWLKLKPVHSFDLVVLAAEWGSGRRRGWLSNLHLGARDAESGELVMLGKTFKGLTDELLAWQTEALLARETRRDQWTVFVRPELVVEIAAGGVQRSPQYPAGLALRFARVRRYRPDKRAQDATTLDEIRALAPAPEDPG